MKRFFCILSVLLFLVTLPIYSAGDSEKSEQSEEFNILYFVGGHGEMANAAVEELRKSNPDVDINLEYNHKAQDILRNSMMAGNPPDIFNINKGLYSHYGAIEEGLLGSVEFILDAPALDGEGSIRDRLVKTNVDGIGFVDGVHYTIPDVSYLGGLWYDEKLMEEMGIEVDTNWTWDDFMSTLGVLKENGIEPFAYYGQFSHEYPLDYFLLPLIASIDYDAFLDIQNLTAGAWESESVKIALNRIVDMVDNGYIWEPSVGAGGEVQMEFVRGNVGFYPCGSWLHAEMADSWPDDFDLRFLPIPGKEDTGGTNYVFTTDLISAIPAEVKNKDLTIQYYQQLFTNDEVIEETVEDNQFIMPIVGFADEFGHLLPDPVTYAVKTTDDHPTMTSMLTLWYPELTNEVGDSINALVAGDIGVSDFGERVETVADRIRSDSSIPKYDY